MRPYYRRKMMRSVRLAGYWGLTSLVSMVGFTLIHPHQLSIAFFAVGMVSFIMGLFECFEALGILMESA